MSKSKYQMMDALRAVIDGVPARRVRSTHQKISPMSIISTGGHDVVSY
jgi:hypothetical protein